MIPTIGLMIGGYIILRCLEMLAVRDEHWSGKAWGAGMRIMGMLTLAATSYLAAELVRSGSDLANKLTIP